MCAQTDGTSSSTSDLNNADNDVEPIFSHFPTYTDWRAREGNQQPTLEQYHDELYTFGLQLNKDRKLPKDTSHKGHTGGMNAYGINLMSGNTPDGFRDTSEGLAWVEKSAKLGFPKAQRNLAIYLSEGIICEQNGVEALRWVYAAIEQGDVEAYCTIGSMYMDGDGVPSDLPKAAELFQRGMDTGSIRCIARLGHLYQEGRGVTKNVPRAVELYEKAVDLGDLVGYNYLGSLYEDGDDGIPIDLSRAIKYYELAAEANVVSAMRNLGQCYEYGTGVPQSYEISMQYYLRAAKYDDSYSLHCLGLMYRHGKGVQQDDAKAREFFERAAEQKQEEAMCALGFLVGEGLGGTKDPVRAAELFQQSAALGDGLGAYNAGVVFENGEGVPANPHKALEYYRLALSLDCDLPLEPNSNFMSLLHSVGITYLRENKRKEASDHFHAAAQLGHAWSITMLSRMYADAFWGMDAASFDTDMCYFTPPQTPDTTLSILPVELVTQVFQWLHPKQCIKLRATTRRMLALIDDDSFSRHVFQFNALMIPSRADRRIHWFDKMLFHGPHSFQVAYVEMRLNGIQKISHQERKYVSHTEYEPINKFRKHASHKEDGPKPINKFPAAFLHWTSLTSLQLSGLQLTGAIPEGIKYLQNLKEVDLSRNMFDGTTIPTASIMALKSLEVLLLKGCGLIGDLEMEFVTFLQTLMSYSLCENNLTFSGPKGLKWVEKGPLEESQ
ncbi:hypothetical protein HDU81_007279 [Chytriomyces hyalinus]|nr:hypothetical protein HDU81_007279 [Chytriomyces hyalinus]